MPNKAIHQLPFDPVRRDDDRLYVVRDGADYQIPMGAMAPQMFSHTVTIPSSSVLTLSSSPVEVVPACPPGFAIFPVRAVIQFLNGTVDYTSDEVLIGDSTLLSDTDYALAGQITDRTTANAMYQRGYYSFVGESNSLSIKARWFDPIDGNSNLVITTFYYLMPV